MAQQMCSQCGRLVAPTGVEFVNRKTGSVSTGRAGVAFLSCCTIIAAGLASVPVCDALLWHYASDGFSARVLAALLGLSAIALFFLVLTLRSCARDWNADLVQQLHYECHGCRQCWSWRIDQPFGADNMSVAARTRAADLQRTNTLVRWYIEDVAQRGDVRSKI